MKKRNKPNKSKVIIIIIMIIISILGGLGYIAFNYIKKNNTELKKENVTYGFKLYKKQKNKQGQVRYIYKNKNSLPFGYTLNNYVSSEKYETYTTLQKEQ